MSVSRLLWSYHVGQINRLAPLPTQSMFLRLYSCAALQHPPHDNDVRYAKRRYGGYAIQDSDKLGLTSKRTKLHLIRRWYQHASPHAPGPKNSSGVAYSRQDLMSWWHREARESGTTDKLRWEGRDEIDAKCIIIKSDGSIERPPAALNKRQVTEKFGLQARDLRSLDAHLLDVRPSLLIGKRAIIICTPIVRAIIAHNELVIMGADKANPLVTDDQADELVEAIQEVMRYLEVTGNGVNEKQKTPFEFRALEALLLLTVKGFKNVATELQDRVYGIIPQLRFGVSPAELKNLLESKRTVEDCLYSGRAMQSAVSAVLSEDEDLAAMFLTDKANGNTKRDVADHQMAELLLEYYERRLDETNEASLRLSSLLSDIDSNITLVLASTRVKLQNLELQTAITTLALGAGTALFGLFGMNLVSGFEDSPTAFYCTTGVGIGFMGIIMVIGYVRLFRARRSQLFLGSAVRERQQDIKNKFAGYRSRLAANRSIADSQGSKDEQAKIERSAKEDQEREGAEEGKKDGSSI